MAILFEDGYFFYSFIQEINLLTPKFAHSAYHINNSASIISIIAWSFATSMGKLLG